MALNSGPLAIGAAIVTPEKQGAVLEAPVISTTGNLTADEDASSGTVTITVTDADTSPANLLLVATSANTTLVPQAGVSLVAGATVGTWTLSVTPAPDANGVTQIDLVASDPEGDSDTEIVTVTVNPLADPPTIAPINNVSIPANTVAGPIDITITDPDGFAGHIVSAISSNASLVNNGTGFAFGGSDGNRTITITPVTGASGTTTITVTVKDGAFTVNEDFDLTVTSVAPSISISNMLTATEDGGVSNTATITLTDPDTAPASLTLTATSASTTLIPQANVSLTGGGNTWTLTVTPAANQNGTGQINLLAGDGTPGHSDTDVVTVTVAAVNDPPTIAPISDLSTAENTATSPIPVTITDVDGFVGHVVAVESSNASVVAPSGISLTGSGGSRSLVLTPQPGALGSTTITVRLTDGPYIVTEDFVLTVNPSVAPSISISNMLTATEDGGVSNTATITLTDPDTAPASLTLTATSASTTLIPQANVSLTGGGNTWTLTVTPAANQNGTGQINLLAGDGTPGHSDTDVVTVTVAAVNDAPTIAPISDLSTAENTATAPIPVTITDVDGFVGHVVAVESSNASVVAPSGISLTGSGGSRSLVLTPQPGALGSTTITVRLTDGPHIVTEDFVLTVNPSVAPSISISNMLTATEDGGVSNTATITLTDPDTAPASLTLTATSASTTLIPQANVSLTGGGNTWTLTVTPAPNQNGTGQINLLAGDGIPGHSDTDVVTVTVAAVNDPPTIAPISDLSTAENTATAPIPVTITDVDGFVGHVVAVESSNASVVAPSGISLTGTGGSRSLVLTPQPGASGSTTITVRLTDGPHIVTEDFVLTVNPSVAPSISISNMLTATEDGGVSNTATITLTDPDTAPASLTLTATSANTTLIPQANVSLTGGGNTWTLRATPAANQNGTGQINLLAGDGTPGHRDTDVVTVTVAAVNDPPTIAPISDLSTAENTATAPISVTITDVDGFVGHVVAVESSNASVVAPSGISLTGSGGSRSLVLTPQPGASGSTTITIRLTDGPHIVTEDFVLTVNPSVAPSISISNMLTATEDGGVSNTATITLTDPDTAPASLTLTATSANTTLIPQANVSLTGGGNTWTLRATPAANQNGTTQINLLAGDGTPGHSDTDVVTVTVAAVNDPPTIAPISDLSTAENTATAPIPVTITDVDGFVGHVVAVESSNASVVAPSGISLTGTGGSRSLVLTPQPGASGSTTITVRLTDGPHIVTEDFVLTVNPSVAPSISISNMLTATEDGGVSNTATITLTDPDTAPASLTLTATSANTTLIPQANVSLTGGGNTWTLRATPAANQNGTGQINLLAGDGTPGHSDTDVVTVTVSAVNDAPTIATIGNQSINQNTSTAPIPVTIADIDNDVNTLTLDKNSSNTTLVPLTGIVFGGAGAGRNVTITPTPGQFGTANITIIVQDAGNATAQTTFQLTVLEVNQPPVFVTTIGNRTINEDGALGSVPFTIGDPNTPVASLTLRGSSSNTALVDEAGIAFGGTGADRNVTVTPNINAFGVSNITLRVSDGTLFADMSFVLTVNSVNDLPTITSIPPQTIDENGQTGLLGFTIADLETPVVDLRMTSASSNTVLADEPQIQFTGTGSLRNVNVIPKINKSGTATITLTVRDADGGTAQSAFLLTVTAVDAPPTISAISDMTLTEDIASPAVPFTVNDIDVPADQLTVSKQTSNTAVVADGGIQLVEVSPGSWTVKITPVSNASGSSLITLTVDDGTGEQATETFTVTVNADNDKPVMTPVIGTQNINEDFSTGNISFTISDVETPAASLTVDKSSSNQALVPDANVVIGGSGGSRNVTVTPLPNQSGSTDITIKITDTDGGITSQTFTVNVAAVNDDPTITAIGTQNITEDQPGGTGPQPFTVGDEDVSTLTIDKSSSNTTLVPNANISLSGSGTAWNVTVVPVANGFGTATITLTVTDAGTRTATTTFNVVVAPVNDPPTITKPPTQTIAENATTGPIPFTVGDVESLGTLVVTRATSNAALIPLANIVLGGSGANRTVTASPLAAQSGTATITLTVDDGSVQVSQTFDVVVTAVEDFPTISAIDDVTINEDGATTAIPFTIGDPDTPIGSLLLSKSSDNQSLIPDANVVLGGSGASRNVTVTPLPNQNGSATISITVTDGINVVTEIFVVTVTPVNDTPTITAIADQVTTEDVATGAINFTVGDLETGAGALQVTATSDNVAVVPNAPANIELTGEGVGAARTIRIVPAPDASGVANITVKVSDGPASATRTFKVTVSADDDAPTISAIGDQNITEDAVAGPIPFTIGDVDTPGAPGTLQVNKSSSNTTLIPDANVVIGGSGASRSVTITPALNQSGTATISISVYDGHSTTVRDFIVNVSPVDDSPTISAIANRSTAEDTPAGPIPFTISDPETAVSDLVVSKSTNNPTLFPIDNIVLSGTTGSRNVTITPAQDLNGSGTITISVFDGANTTSRTFTLTVTPVNDPPVITSQDPISVNEGVAVTLDFVMLHVVDPDNVLSELTLVPFGGDHYSISGSTTIKPDAFYNGPLTVPVRVTDGGPLGPVFNVAITVISTNDPPTITGQPAVISMNEDQTYAIPITAFTISDVDSDASLRKLKILPGTNYTVSEASGVYSITPSANYYGTLIVSVVVNDGDADSAPFNANVTVNAVNDPPAITGQNPISTNEETELELNAGLFNITDPEMVPFTIVVEPAAANAPYTVTGINKITPKENQTGVITVPLRASDGLLTSEVFNAQVTIAPINDPPKIVGQTLVTTVEDIPVTIRVTQLDVQDPDNSFPTGFSMTVSPGTNYTFSQVSVTEYVITPSLDFTGTLSVNVQVSDGLANSTPWPMQITVTDDADAPVINGPGAPLVIAEDTRGTLTIDNLSYIDTDTQKQDLTIDILAGTNYTFQNDDIIPSANFFGTLTVNVRIYDGKAYSNTFPLSVTVTPAYDPPSFNPIATINILEDAPQQTLNVVNISAGPKESEQMFLSFSSDNTALIPTPTPQQLTLPPGTTSASAIYRPVANQSGTVTMRITLIDSPPGAGQDVTINVAPINDAPTFSWSIDNDEVSMEEGTGVQNYPLNGISAGGGAPEAGQTLKFIVGTDNEELFETLPQVPNPASGQTSGTLTFKPKENAFGVAHVTVRLQDDGASSPAPNVNFIEKVLTITITPVNDAPVIVSTPVEITEPGKEYTYEFIVTDVDNDDITITAPGLPSWLTFTQGENGHATISGIPPSSDIKSASISLIATDEAGVAVSGSYTLTINSRPVVTNFTMAVAEDTHLSITSADFSLGFYDPEGNPIAEVLILSLPEHGTLSTAAGAVTINQKLTAEQLATLSYQPSPDYFGPDSFLWTGADGFEAYPENQNGAVLNISVEGVNDAPTFTMEAETDTLKYELGSEADSVLTRRFVSKDDGGKLTYAQIGFNRIEGFQYRPENDVLTYKPLPSSPITGSFNEGTLTLQGVATTAEYDQAMRNVFYKYTNASEFVLDMRSVSIVINDGLLSSTQQSRLIQLIYTFEDLKIPSAFSPNEGDDVNNVWNISSRTENLYDDAEVRVYNKNGLLLFETKGLQDPWTGVYNGALLPTDTYYYTIDLHYNKVRYKGAVTLLR
ncbi:Ig-like domain-containing protein [Chryseolinea sp. T2]|uniref:tandem-95 repeat protein n=1 Tax=Chryseolinea sp. T2 TaxID=3129255 RepID=UPI00307710A8